MKLPRVIPFSILAVAAVALAAAAAPELDPWLCYDRNAILAGQLWRLITGHLVHSSAYHLLWNLAGLIGLGVLVGRDLGRQVWSALVVGAVTVSVGLLVLDPALEVYRGLSGVLNTLLVAGSLSAWRQEKAAGNRVFATAFVVLVGLALGKIALEALTGVSLLTDGGKIGGVAVPMAHALGALAGTVRLPGGPQSAAETAPKTAYRQTAPPRFHRVEPGLQSASIPR